MWAEGGVCCGTPETAAIRVEVAAACSSSVARWVEVVALVAMVMEIWSEPAC